MIRIGTRGSNLALAQAHRVRQRLGTGEIVVIRSSGDASSAPIAQLGVGIFTRELEDALRDRRIDLAVHSLKDLPSEIAPGLALAAIPEREDVRDAVAGKRLSSLAAGARVASSSPRRQDWLRRRHPHLVPVEVRGNVDTRLRKLDEGAFEALVVAMAALARLGLEGRAEEVMSLEELIPPAGQGALAVESRAGEESLAAGLDVPSLRVAVECERALFRELRAGCRTPLGAHAEVTGGGIRLRADLAGIRAEHEGPDPAGVARAVSAKILQAGGSAHLPAR